MGAGAGGGGEPAPDCRSDVLPDLAQPLDDDRAGYVHTRLSASLRGGECLRRRTGPLPNGGVDRRGRAAARGRTAAGRAVPLLTEARSGSDRNAGRRTYLLSGWQVALLVRAADRPGAGGGTGLAAGRTDVNGL